MQSPILSWYTSGIHQLTDLELFSPTNNNMCTNDIKQCFIWKCIYYLFAPKKLKFRSRSPGESLTMNCWDTQQSLCSGLGPRLTIMRSREVGTASWGMDMVVSRNENADKLIYLDSRYTCCIIEWAFVILKGHLLYRAKRLYSWIDFKDSQIKTTWTLDCLIFNCAS